MVPGIQAFASAEAAAANVPPALADAQFSPALPPPPAQPQAGPANAPFPAYSPYGPYGSYGAYPAYPQPVAVPYYYPVPVGMPQRVARGSAPRPPTDGWSQVAPNPQPLYYYPEVQPPPDTQYASTAAGVRSLKQSEVPVAGSPQAPIAKRFDRLQLTAWALLRGSPGPGNLATGGTLGGSQVGGRLTWNFTPAFAASLRSSSLVGGVR